jgi:hypothetical protein
MPDIGQRCHVGLPGWRAAQGTARIGQGDRTSRTESSRASSRTDCLLRRLQSCFARRRARDAVHAHRNEWRPRAFKRARRRAWRQCGIVPCPLRAVCGARGCLRPTLRTPYAVVRS